VRQRLGALVFAAVYVLVLATQLPHIWAAYASLEDASIPLAQWTALGAAVAFELSIGVFTYRLVKGSRRRWTKRGLLFFIVASIVANAYYYEAWPFVFDRLMPWFATIALPFALALFAEEFGAETKNVERRLKRDEKKLQGTEPDATPMQVTEATTKTAQVIRLAQLHPEWSRMQLAQEVGCSASTVTRALMT
jgi:uncharacterized membrane protein